MAERFFCPTIRASNFPQALSQLNNRLQLMTRMLNSISTGPGIPESRLTSALTERWNAKIITFYQDDEPTSAESGLGDLWVDTNDTNKLYRYDGTDWVTVVDTDIAQAISDASDAQFTADGKIVTFVQASAPTAEDVGDIWFDSDDDYKPYRWSGSTWDAVDFDVATWSKIIGAGKPEDGADVTGDHSEDVNALLTTNAPAEASADVTSNNQIADKRGLVVKLNASNPNYQVDVDADYLKLDESTLLLSSVDLTIDISAGTGANKLDTGSEAANTWYSIWVICNPTTDTVAGLFSTSTTSPTMPSGYTKKRRVGWVRNIGTSNFWKFYQIGDWWHWDYEIDILTTNSAANSWTDIDCSSAIPPTSELMYVWIASHDSNGESTLTSVRRNGMTGGVQSYIHMRAGGATASEIAAPHILVSCDDNRIIEYYNDPGDQRAYISVQGYYDLI